MLGLNCAPQDALGNSSMSRAFDNVGNESIADLCTIADKRQEQGNFGGIRSNTISGVPVQASLLFSHVSASASALSLVSVKGWVKDWGGPPVSVSFRNVLVIR